MDKDIYIDDLKNIVKNFCDDREWNQFHDAKELAIGISTEANELLQHFRFKSKEEIENMFTNKEKVECYKDELSDIFYFILRFAQLYNIDLSDSLINKIEKNSNKYPIEISRGNNRKYNED